MLAAPILADEAELLQNSQIDPKAADCVQARKQPQRPSRGGTDPQTIQHLQLKSISRNLDQTRLRQSRLAGKLQSTEVRSSIALYSILKSNSKQSPHRICQPLENLQGLTKSSGGTENGHKNLRI
jgi:hypothetical protein